jgi:hypothetical protein
MPTAVAADAQTHPDRFLSLAWILAACAQATSAENNSTKWNNLAADLIHRAHEAGTFRNPQTQRQLKTDSKFAELRKRPEIQKVIQLFPAP